MLSAGLAVAGIWLKGTAWPWLKGLPWYVIALVIVGVFAAVQLGEARHWHKLADRRAALLKDVRDAQATADTQARANQATKATAHAANAKDVTDDAKTAHAVAGDAAAALRLRIAELERAARARTVPSASGTAGIVDAADDPRLSLTDELALRQQCEAERIDRAGLIKWEGQRLAIELLPAPDP